MKKDRKNLRWGYSTGACAAAAAKAAWIRLTRGGAPQSIWVHFLDGRERELPLLQSGAGHMAAIRKNGGDDPDCTHGATLYADIRACLSGEIRAEDYVLQIGNGTLILRGAEGIGLCNRRGLDCETSTPLIFDRYLTADSIRMFESTGVLNKVEIEARTEVKWETYTKKIQIEGRVLGDLTMNHIVPIASRYEAMLLDKVYKMAQIGGLDASADIDLLKKIQGHTAAIQTLTIEMIEARKKANRIENARAKAIAYHDTVEVYFEEIRRHIDKLEEIIDDQMWTLPKYRELLFIK